jgi:hypothetical protein
MEGEELEMYPFSGVSQVGFHGLSQSPTWVWMTSRTLLFGHTVLEFKFSFGGFLLRTLYVANCQQANCWLGVME